MSSEEDQQESYASALAENIAKKGNNAYYYAHGKKIDGPAWDGKEQPRLLNVTEVQISAPKLAFTTLDSFSWLDGKKSVKIYIDFENADQVSDEHISLVTEEKSFEFKFSTNGKTYILIIGPLYNGIEGASFKKKSDKFIVSLNKSVESSWFQLKASS